MAANTYVDGLMPRIIANSRKYLRRQAVWLKIINKDFSDASGRVGQKIDIPIPQPLDVQDLVAGQLPPVAAGKDFPTAQLTLDKAKISEPFTVEQIHFQNYAISGPNSVLQEQINAGIDAVIGALAEDMWCKYYEVPTFVGETGKQFFHDADDAPSIDRLADASGQLFVQRVPPARPKYGIFGYQDWITLRKVQEVRQAYSIGTPGVIQDDNWPSILGYGLKEDYFAPTHTVGTITNNLVCDGITAAGQTSVTVKTPGGGDACALKQGDIVTITTGGTAYQYSLTADLTLAGSSSGSMAIDRALEVATVDLDAIAIATNFGSGRIGILGDMMGVSAVTRLPSNPADVAEMPVDLAGLHIPITDDISGASVLLSFFGQFFQRTMIVSLIFGTKYTDPRRVTRGLSA